MTLMGGKDGLQKVGVVGGRKRESQGEMGDHWYGQGNCSEEKQSEREVALSNRPFTYLTWECLIEGLPLERKIIYFLLLEHLGWLFKEASWNSTDEDRLTPDLFVTAENSL